MNYSLQWDIFCKVIDNFGDIGVCWRLATDLAGRGHQVRLWADDAAALRWMAPGGCEGVRVLPWGESLDLSAADLEHQPCDVMIEAFGCEIAPEFIATCAYLQSARGQKPVWINLEYLSAESYVERSHALPSLVRNGPATGWTKWFFYPGFTALTGGLLREPGLVARQAAFDRPAWLATHGVLPNELSGVRLVSLFCYEPALLAQLLTYLNQHGLDGQPVHLLVTAGRAEKAVKAVLNDEKWKKWLQPLLKGRKQLSISYLDLLTQTDFDHLLWACDLNFVRGEDSLVRALWAGKPFVWQIYPQSDQAHFIKLQAFLDVLDAPSSLQAFWRQWNSENSDQEATLNGLPSLASWQAEALAARVRLMFQDDLTTQLLRFVAKNR